MVRLIAVVVVATVSLGLHSGSTRRDLGANQTTIYDETPLRDESGRRIE